MTETAMLKMSKSIIDFLKDCPNLTISVSAKDLMEFTNKITESIENIQKMFSAAGTDEYLTAEKVCEMLSVSKPTLWRWSKIGYLKPVRIGGKVRYKMSDIKSIIFDYVC